MWADRLRRISWRDGALAAVVAAVLVSVLISGAWLVRHATAIYALRTGVGGTMFYDAEGQPWFPLDELRNDVPMDRISPFFKDAVIAIEDHRFYHHPGIDPIGLARAVVVNLRSGAAGQGGSTITQQLARTLFLSNVRTLTRKVREAALAVLLEAILSKRRILELYFDRVYLSGGVYGVESMSQKLFGTHAADLTLAQAALIAGVIRAPAAYSPWTHLDAARARSTVVLRRMREEGTITEAQEAAARAEALHVLPQSSVSSAAQGYVKEYLRQQFRDTYGGDNPPDWKVQTTFVPAVQDAAEAAVREGLRAANVPGLQAALVAIDPSTGNILAMVGGSDFASTPFNRAVRSRRQSGSAFKPFVYAAALERGLSPVSTVEGLQSVAIQAAEGSWTPRDERPTTRDRLTLREALAESNNAAAVLLQRRVGSAPVLRLANDVGVRDQPDVPSLALGSGLVSPLDLTAAYAVFPSLGVRVRPRGLVSVEDADGEEVQRRNIEAERILSPEVAFQMVTMLEDVVETGTGAGARRLGVHGAIGGKTGTTNDYRDAWFVGFNSSVVVGVWVGFDRPARIRDGATGARMALPIWANFMTRTAARFPSRAFEPPEGLHGEVLCRVSFDRAVDGCPGYTEYFKSGDAVPSRLCVIHPGSMLQRTERAMQGVGSWVSRGLRRLFGR